MVRETKWRYKTMVSIRAFKNIIRRERIAFRRLYSIFSILLCFYFTLFAKFSLLFFSHFRRAHENLKKCLCAMETIFVICDKNLVFIDFLLQFKRCFYVCIMFMCMCLEDFQWFFQIFYFRRRKI